jgi:hypothetical protein
MATDRTKLTVAQILAWADAHRRRTGAWPRRSSGTIPQAPGRSGSAVQDALRRGLRGLPGGSSLARLLTRARGVRNPAALPGLTEAVILAWADAHRRRTGRWPGQRSGPVVAQPGETWMGLDLALLLGLRGLAGGSSWARLLARERGARNRAALPRLTVRQILARADAHHGRTGQWPQARSGPIAEAAGESWDGVNQALRKGLRGLPGGDTLARLLHQHRGLLIRGKGGR